jgi:hypothetical protein
VRRGEQLVLRPIFGKRKRIRIFEFGHVEPPSGATPSRLEEADCSPALEAQQEAAEAARTPSERPRIRWPGLESHDGSNKMHPASAFRAYLVNET